MTSQMANAPLRTTPWTSCTFRSLLRSWAFIRSCQILLLHFLTSKSEQFCGFLCFHFCFKFFKSIRVLPNFTYNICEIFIDFFPFPSSLSSSCFKLFKPESESSFSDSLLVPKILFRLQASSLSSSAWTLTLSSYSCTDSSPPEPLWHSFLSSALALGELILSFCFFFLCFICSSS